jgi:hypothetical protein
VVSSAEGSSRLGALRSGFASVHVTGLERLATS